MHHLKPDAPLHLLAPPMRESRRRYDEASTEIQRADPAAFTTVTALDDAVVCSDGQLRTDEEIVRFNQSLNEDEIDAGWAVQIGRAHV